MHTEECGKGGNPEKCGEMCFANAEVLPGSKETFYCNKGEKCCPKLPQDEECAALCPTYDRESIYIIIYYFTLTLSIK